jgi:ubiquinone biosynthesis protein
MRRTTRRAGEVATVLARHGLGSLADVVDVRKRRRRRRGARGNDQRVHVAPVRLRLALEELGPTFMKLGQVLSTRPDIVPPAFEAELSLLQDAAPPVPNAEIVRAIETALGRPIDDAYATFDPSPLAAASIGQVHAARLATGQEVVVKVRRPGVVDAIALDLALLDRVARVVARQPLLERYDPVGLAREFRTTIEGELDYVAEGRNAVAVAAAFADSARVHVPAVFWSHTGASVITEERVRGTKIDDLDALARGGTDRSAVARDFADAYLSMVFDHRFFHADPHPGNVFVEDDGRIAFVDFGMVGSVDARTATGLGQVLLALVAVDASAMADGLFALGVAGGELDRADFERDLDGLLQRYGSVPLEQLRIGPLLNDVMAVVRAHRLRLPSDLALLLKTVMMCEGVAAKLDPGFELVPVLVPHAARLTSPKG